VAELSSMFTVGQPLIVAVVTCLQVWYRCYMSMLRTCGADPDPAFNSDADPDPAPTFQFAPDLAPAFHSDACPAPTFQFAPDLDPTTHFSPDFDPPMLQKNDPRRLPLFHFDVDPDPWDPAFYFDADPPVHLSTLIRIRIRIKLSTSSGSGSSFPNC
jgi:hypothetical protein